MNYEAIVVGVSSGGMNAMRVIFSLLPKNFKTPIIIVQHIGKQSNNKWIELMSNSSKIPIKEADEKEKITRGLAYIAPPNYHLLVEKSKTFSLTVDERVNFSRPSIDVLFESAAEAYRSKLIGVILTGSSADGTKGLKHIKECGGVTIVQEPSTAESDFMPASAIAAMQVDYILPLDGIIDLLIKIA